MNSEFFELNKKITKCKKCPRLVKFRNKISIEKRKQNINDVYWGKPVAGFGDQNSKILILGLAPAAHGGTRTGRAFTGDKSGDFLFKCLYSAKIANHSFSNNINDGLKLKSTYITNILKCVPPGDKPQLNELNNCSNFFKSEISKLKNLRVIVTLGKVAFDNCIKFYKKEYDIDKKIIFKHGKKYELPDGKFLIPCYHPSPRNVNTKIINLKMMKSLFIKAKHLA
ncbi:uracil-DNA glycosylase [Candidatus Pelagibacter sp.]|jgi:uracil-DNA glycosylase family 4|nr:uracil-DNA glycosylase [Candidatus Pelagibacter sp.]